VFCLLARNPQQERENADVSQSNGSEVTMVESRDLGVVYRSAMTMTEASVVPSVELDSFDEYRH
jgi:hypothetical protein